jgi:hypothetical protein
MFHRLTLSLRTILLSTVLAIPVAAYAAPNWASPALPGGLGGAQTPSVGQTFMTPRGLGVVTGTSGSVDTTSIPGRPGQGFLVNNGNGTSTLIAPGGAPLVVMTPR